MPLVGVIEPGTVERILQSVSFAKADVLVLLTRDQQSGHVLLELGQVVTARLGELRDDEAIGALKQWPAGHYTLIKRGHASEGVQGHVVLNILGTRTRRALERWLKQQGYQTSIVGYPEQAMQIIDYLQPDVLLTACPRQALGLSCKELTARLHKDNMLPPAIIALDVAAQGCTEPTPPCVRVAGTVETVQQALDDDWQGTRFGVRKASAESTAKVVIPLAHMKKPPSEELLASALAALPARDHLTARDLLLALGVLVFGTGVIYWNQLVDGALMRAVGSAAGAPRAGAERPTTLRAGGSAAGAPRAGAERPTTLRAGGSAAGAPRAGAERPTTLRAGGSAAGAPRAGAERPTTLRAGGSAAGAPRAGAERPTTLRAGGSAAGAPRAGAERPTTLRAGGSAAGAPRAGAERPTTLRAGGSAAGAPRAGAERPTTLRAGGSAAGAPRAGAERPTTLRAGGSAAGAPRAGAERPTTLRAARLLLKPGAVIVAAALWLPLLHLLYRPGAEERQPRAGLSPRAAALAHRQLQLWNDTTLRDAELERMRRHNAEWDFMGRTFLVLALGNIGLREPARKAESLAAMDRIIDETLRLERQHGFVHFTLPYARRGPFVVQPPRSVFVDGEIALMLAARRLLAERAAYRPLLAERIATMVERMRRGPVLSAESYPDECWTFCNTVALAALRLGDALDGTDHSALRREWVATARRRLVHPATGLLISSYTVAGRPKDGPEGSSIWMAAHMLQLVDPSFAEDQYRRARRELGRELLGFGYAREWPASWQGPMDIDSGPVVPLLQASASSSGLGLMAAAAFDDRQSYTALLTSLQYAAFPAHRQGGLTYLGANAVGEAVILYAMTLGPQWREATRRSSR